AVLCVSLSFSAVYRSSAQQAEANESTRKVVSRPAPVYPALARTMSLKGSVRMDAVVAPNGTVRSVVLKGRPPRPGPGCAEPHHEVALGTNRARNSRTN